MLIDGRALGEHLIQWRVVARDVVEGLLAAERRDGVPLSRLLIGEGLVSEKDLVRAVAAEVGTPFADLAHRFISSRWHGAVPEDLARGYLSVALGDDDDGRVLVAMENPHDPAVIEALTEDLGRPIVAMMASRSELEDLIEDVYGDGAEYSGAEARSDLEGWLAAALEREATDVHLVAGAPPRCALEGVHERLSETLLTGAAVRAVVEILLTPEEQGILAGSGSVVRSRVVAGVGRVRVAAESAMTTAALALRIHPGPPPTIGGLGLDASLAGAVAGAGGLVVVAGPRGSGRSSLLHALVDERNNRHGGVVVTVEAPVAWRHDSREAVIHQREVGVDVADAATAVAQAASAGPDVLVLDDPGDPASLRAAVDAAASGIRTLVAVDAVDFPTAMDAAVRADDGGARIAHVLVGALVCARPDGGPVTIDGVKITAAVAKALTEGRVWSLK